MLSEEKIDELIEDVFVPEGLHPFARAIEAAVLEEQAKQKPVAWLGHDDFGYNVVKMAKDEDAVIPLYLHPSPVPEGMVLVPREPTEKMLKATMAPTLKHEIAIWYMAMVAAAEKP